MLLVPTPTRFLDLLLLLLLPVPILGLLLALPCASANTEIRNFHASASVFPLPHVGVSEVTAAWPVLNASTSASTRAFAVVPAPLGTLLRDVCGPMRVADAEGSPHELWVRLDLDDAPWARFEHFTLRVSWPAFYPTEFDIALYTPTALLSHLQALLNTISSDPDPDLEPKLKSSSMTRVQYARIRLVDTGVRPPLPPLSSPSSTKPPRAHADADPVPFTLTLEPLLLGVLPSSLLPTLLLLVPALAAAALALPPTLRALEGVVVQARKELGYPDLKRD
ncbi:hypothetical protein M0805_008195 [Coniferiporia weirii]|nr:hypothetical protein M0805_008195 [Coniferiporia weirii]